jgi:orotidine-5'-phosphate decarboxylase
MDMLRRRWVEGGTLLCVGLDPDLARLPGALLHQPEPLLRFCTAIVDATADLVCAFKPQIAYFAAAGAEEQLARLIAHIHQHHPHVPVILDAKRGDIGDTARLYAMEAFARFGADAVTVNPFLGRESLEPYLAHGDRGVVVLCRTSNADSAWLQNHPPEDPVFLRIARAAVEWNTAGNVMLVAGATYADDLARIRRAAADLPLLVPGVGAQGGDLAAVIAAGLDSAGHGLVVNASRSVLYAAAQTATGAAGDDVAAYAAEARRAAAALRDRIERLRAPRVATSP